MPALPLQKQPGRVSYPAEQDFDWRVGVSYLFSSAFSLSQ